jgi:dihydrolipoamide dehydrogenase
MKTEVAVIGAGPGGYVAAIRLAQLGKKVVLIEENKLGGTCLNYGCIPSKALINAANFFDKIKKSSDIGINAENVKIDFKKMQEWKNNIVLKLVKGVEFLCKKNDITIVKGMALFESANKLKINGTEECIEFENAIIATGSETVEIPGLKFDGKTVISSREALYMEDIPKNLAIIGGGYIGLEIGTAYAKLGSKVSIIELSDQILQGFDKSIMSILHKKLERLEVKIFLNSKAEKIDGNSLIIHSKEKGKISLEADKILVAVGRKPNTTALGMENTNIKIDERGFIKVDNHLRTNEKNIFAVGDVSLGPMLAHKASYQGKLAAEIINGDKTTYENVIVPAAIFTDPEIATIGMTENEAIKHGIKIKMGKFPLSASGRAMTKNETEGFIKLITDENDKLLGAEIFGSEASEIISEISLAIKMNAKSEDIASTIHPHPTLSETLGEAAEATIGKAIHMLNPR